MDEEKERHGPAAGEPTPGDGEHPSRRRFCQAAIGGLTLVSAATVGYPVLTFLGRPIRLDASKPLEVPLDQLAAGQAYYAEFRGAQLILLVTDEGVHVFSASCPHLGCNVIWNAADARFQCPCHGAVFNASGKVISGPVSGSLKSVPFEIKAGKVVVA